MTHVAAPLRIRSIQIKILELLGILLACASTVVQAQTDIYLGEDVSPWPLEGPNDVPKPTNVVQTLQAANRFFSRLPGVLRETFEQFPTGASPSTLMFGTNTAFLTGDGYVNHRPALLTLDELDAPYQHRAPDLPIVLSAK